MIGAHGFAESFAALGDDFPTQALLRDGGNSEKARKSSHYVSITVA